MKQIKRKSSARWYFKAKGDPKIMIDSRSLLKHASYGASLPLSDRIATSAAELMATAHALCFSMELSSQLGLRSVRSGRFNTTATVTLENWVSGWKVTNVHLNILARLPMLSQCDFIDATVRAKTSCFISQLTKSNISLSAKLKN